jgi:hypothetical protein
VLWCLESDFSLFLNVGLALSTDLAHFSEEESWGKEKFHPWRKCMQLVRIGIG